MIVRCERREGRDDWGHVRMRILLDEHGTEWTVFEVKRGTGGRDRMSYLPERFGDGWLCFESKLGKRRLTPVPARWRDLGDEEMTRLLGRATAVNRTRDSGDVPRIGGPDDEPRIQG
jgi:hypothetical protein